MTDWQTAKARASADAWTAIGQFAIPGLEYAHVDAVLKALRESGYGVVRLSDPPQHVRSLGFQAHANGGPKAFGAAYEVMVKEMAKETAE